MAVVVKCQKQKCDSSHLVKLFSQVTNYISVLQAAEHLSGDDTWNTTEDDSFQKHTVMPLTFVSDVTFTAAALNHKVDKLQKPRLSVSSVLIQPIIYHCLRETGSQRTEYTVNRCDPDHLRRSPAAHCGRTSLLHTGEMQWHGSLSEHCGDGPPVSVIGWSSSHWLMDDEPS